MDNGQLSIEVFPTEIISNSAHSAHHKFSIFNFQFSILNFRDNGILVWQENMKKCEKVVARRELICYNKQNNGIQWKNIPKVRR